MQLRKLGLFGLHSSVIDQGMTRVVTQEKAYFRKFALRTMGAPTSRTVLPIITYIAYSSKG